MTVLFLATAASRSTLSEKATSMMRSSPWGACAPMAPFAWITAHRRLAREALEIAGYRVRDFPVPAARFLMVMA